MSPNLDKVNQNPKYGSQPRNNGLNNGNPNFGNQNNSKLAEIGREI